MEVQLWEREIERALKSCEVEYRPTYSDIALASPRPPEASGLATDMMIAMDREFWRRVCAGETFGDSNRITRRFGRSVEDNYGVRSGPFIDLARTYWTFDLELADIFPAYSDTWLAKALSEIKWETGSLFFPSPGPISLPKKLRKNLQRKYLLEHAPPTFETERYFKENPMLRGWFS